MSDNKEFSALLAQHLGSTHFLIGNQRWHIKELLSVQNILLCNASSLNEGLLWWSKSLSLFDRTLYVESKNGSGFLSLTFRTHGNISLPALAYSSAQNLLTLLGRFTEFHHSWIQTKSHNFPQLRNEFGSGLKIHFDLREVNVKALPEQNMFKLARQVFVMLQKQSIEKEDLSYRLKKHIRDHIDSPLRLPDLARSMGLSARTLQRRLQDKQLNFSTLIENEKKTVALRLLADTDLNTSSIAAQLGYDDSSNFHRAFRKWYAFTPQNYREQCINNRTLQKNNPIRLHYATWNDHNQHKKQGQVWLEVDNIAFEKSVSVECLDRDGVWRHYPAFFEYFLSKGTELWSTANLPVAGPLRFKLYYEINGSKFINDNHQHNYVVNEGILIGQPLIVLPTMIIVHEGGGFRIVIELVCKRADIDKIDCIIDHHNSSGIKMHKTSEKNNYVSWSLSTHLDSLPKRCFFKLHTLDQQELYCDNYQNGYIFTLPR
ncbi:helix-turn-helix transcriptional regulator [Psychromonas ossibalaenae]|uniref:helix-turn-helix transcriptional regulator n=1 Tax=Psychromonas ossibalaenae TaxID=444922 RepID=UPI00036B9C42|nr:AraC family transcriptional regulator [Psychromonas ossibalaenae]